MRSISATTIGSTIAVVNTAPGEDLGGAIAGGERAEQQVLGPDEVVLQPQRLPQRRVEHRFGPLVEGQVAHRVGGLGGEAVRRDQHRSGAIGESAEDSPGGDRLVPHRGTHRCWAACLLTPIAAPIWLHGSPDRRAWSASSTN
jgi:hypothetical protein